MQSVKRFTARQANRLLDCTGQTFWQDESYDRLVRDAAEDERILRYIEMNPVNAGLVAAPEAFPWSSAGQETSGLPPDWADCQSPQPGEARWFLPLPIAPLSP